MKNCCNNLTYKIKKCKLVKTSKYSNLEPGKIIYKNTKNLFEDKISYAKSVSEAINGSQCVIIITGWKQYEKLTKNDFKHMRKKVVIDCRRILVEKQLDVDYFAIGIGK